MSEDADTISVDELSSDSEVFQNTPRQPQDSQAVSPEFLADRRLTESFAKLVVEAYGDEALAVVCLPWSVGNGNPPGGVICPTSKEGDMNMALAEEALQNKNIIVAGCTFKYQDEETAAFKVLEQLSKYQGTKCIVACHLLQPAGNHYARENYGALMQVHQKFHSLGANDVLLDPEWQPSRLKLRMKMAQHSWQINQERLRSMLSEEPQPLPQAEIEALEAAQRQLLWQDIPRELMPHFKAMNADLKETENTVGEYTLGAKLDTRYGVVREAVDKQNRKVAIKIISKSQVFTPGEVEGIYREFRFLVGFIKHPNVVRPVECFHGPQNVYTVLELIQGRNLANLLSDLPGLRMNDDAAFNYFSQIASALGHCHNQNVTHRGVCLEHIVMRHKDDGSYTPKLVDFCSAMVAKQGVTSIASWGCLPCMAPEMMSEGPCYYPKAADCWSVGVVLLEMAGGKGSLCQAVHLDETSAKQLHISGDFNSKRVVRDRITDYFETPGNHAVALATMGGVQNERISEALACLLQCEEKRSDLKPFVIEVPVVDDEVAPSTR